MEWVDLGGLDTVVSVFIAVGWCDAPLFPYLEHYFCESSDRVHYYFRISIGGWSHPCTCATIGVAYRGGCGGVWDSPSPFMW